MGGMPRPPDWRWYSSWISLKTATRGLGLNWSAMAAISREAAGLAEGADEAAILRVGCFEGAPLGDHDGPGDDAHDEQESEHGERGGAAVVQHFHESAGGLAGRRGSERRVGWGLRGGVLQEESKG